MDKPDSPKTVVDAAIAIASAVEANAVALMDASRALAILMDHIAEHSNDDPFAGMTRQ